MTARTLVSATSLAFVTEDESIIRMQATFSEIGYAIPFDATLISPDRHVRQAFARALAGEFGEIAPYVAPPGVTPDDVAAAKASVAELRASAH